MTTKTYETLTKFALKITQNKHDAEDLLHDALLKTYNKLDEQTLFEINENGEIKYYVTRVMLNEFYNKKRLKKEYCIIDNVTLEAHENYNEDTLDEIKRILEVLKKKSKADWFYAHLFEMLHRDVFFETEEEQKQTYRSLHAQTGIGLGTIYYAIKEMNNYLKLRLC